jgi:hypothetical protein
MAEETKPEGQCDIIDPCATGESWPKMGERDDIVANAVKFIESMDPRHPHRVPDMLRHQVWATYCREVAERMNVPSPSPDSCDGKLEQEKTGYAEAMDTVMLDYSQRCANDTQYDNMDFIRQVRGIQYLGALNDCHRKVQPQAPTVPDATPQAPSGKGPK